VKAINCVYDYSVFFERLAISSSQQKSTLDTAQIHGNNI